MNQPSWKPINQRKPWQVFEDNIEKVLTQYSHQELMLIKKVEPPTRTLGSGFKRRVIYLENPFLDFIGAWREQGGRLVCFEAKHTDKPRLPLNDSGLKETQRQAMRSWYNYLGVTFALWGYAGEVRFVSVHLVMQTWRAGAKSIEWEQAEVIPQGKGFVLFDFRVNMLAHFAGGPLQQVRD